MNESIDWKSAVAFAVKGPQKVVFMRVRCVLLLAMLVFANVPAVASAQSSSCPGIYIKILNIRNRRSQNTPGLPFSTAASDR